MPFLSRDNQPSNHSLLASALEMQDQTAWETYPSQSIHGQAITQGGTRPGCSNPGCTNSWGRPWRSRRRPLLEGAWGCSSRCIVDLARSVVLRESSGGLTSPREPHRHRIPLGLVMLAQGWITQSELKRALQAQRAAGHGRIGEWLVSECGIEAGHVLRALGIQWGCPVLRARSSEPRQTSLVLPKQLSREFKVVPWRFLGSGTLQLAFSDTLDASVAFAVEKMSGLQVQSGLVEQKMFSEAHQACLSGQGIATSFESVSGTDALAARIAVTLEKRQPLASRLVRIHSCYWLRLWLESGAIETIGRLPRSNEDMWDYIFRVDSNS